MAALVFGIHPLRVESVGWITDRGDVLCATFYLLAVLAYVRFALGSGRERRRWLIASLAAFAAALLSKEIAMTLPLSLLLLDAYPLRRWAQGLRAVVMEKASYLVLAAIGAAVAVFARGHGASWTSYAEHGLLARVALAAYSLAFYPLKLVWPSGLSPLYELPVHVSPLEPRFVAAGVAVIVVTAILVRAPPSGSRSAGRLAARRRRGGAGERPGSRRQPARRRPLQLPAGIGFAVVAGGGMTAALHAWQRGRLASRMMAALAGVTVAALVTLGALSWQHSWYSAQLREPLALGGGRR